MSALLPLIAVPFAAVPAAGGLGGVEVAYMVAALLFVVGLKRLSRVKTARAGNALASLGMLVAIVATLYLRIEQTESLWVLLIAGVLVGGVTGALLATRVPMTAMPELVAAFNGFGGGASVFVALAELNKFLRDSHADETAQAVTVSSAGGIDFAVAVALSVLIGTITLSGSFVAYSKLAGKIQGSRVGPLGAQSLNVVLAVLALGILIWAGFIGTGSGVVFGGFLALTVVALLLGIGLVVAIGGADMPVVISLLNSYSGLAACATGFVLSNNLLIVAGSLVGASGLILTQIMCKAMNRSLTNVLFGGFGDAAQAGEDTGYSNVKSTSAEELAMVLDAATSCIVVPGYGLAVAQAQHKVREMADILEGKGCEVRYAIHPVAGRMPGHMNVLLAEADVPYEKLFDLDQINSEFKNTDVTIVVGANDVCNPAASDPTSPIAGMPVLNVWDARTCVVIKRSLSAGYAGIKNPLFENDNTLMFFSDGKKALEETITELNDL